MTKVEKLIIPKLIKNTNIKENKSYLKIKKESNEYIKKIYLSEEFKHKRFDKNLAYWSSICYPNVIIKDRICNITKFYTLLFIIDDILENDINSDIKAKRYIDILDKELNNYTTIEKMFKEVCNLIKNDLLEDQILRFIKYTKEWIEGANYLSNFDNYMDKNIYIHHRIKSIGANSSFLSIEYGLDIYFEKENQELFKDIHMVAAKNIIFINDLFSYRKEMYENNKNPNIINIIKNKNNCSLQEAINILEIDIKENYKNFEDIYNTLIRYDNDNIKKYLDGLYDLIIGNLKWSCISPRYHGKDFNSTLINGATIILDKDKTIIVK